MRVIISVILIFAIVISGGILHFFILSNYMNDMNIYIDLLENSILSKDESMLAAALDKTEEKWTKIRRPLCFLINHEFIFEVDGAIAELHGFSKDFDATEALLSVTKIKSCITRIIESSKMSFENII